MICAAASTITDVIRALYEEAEVAPSTPALPVAPLGPVVARLPVRCLEVSGLSSRAAEQILLRRGALIEPLPPGTTDDAPLAGFLFASGAFGAIFVERADPVVRRRFSVAHEIGHYLLHFRPLLLSAAVPDEDTPPLGLTDAFGIGEAEAAVEDTVSNGGGEEDYSLFLLREQEANAFAAEFLMPANVVTALALRFAPDLRGEARTRGEKLAARLATEMLVSQAAMIRRLRHPGLVPAATEKVIQQ